MVKRSLSSSAHEKFMKLVEAEIVPIDAEEVFLDPRVALEFAVGNEVVKTWTDYGTYYLLTLNNGPVFSVAPHQVGEAILDRVIELMEEPIEKPKTPKEKTHKETTTKNTSKTKVVEE